MRILPPNVNPNQRPSNEKLNRESFMNTATAASIGTFLPFIEFIITKDILRIIPFFLTSIALTIVLFVLYNLYRGHRKKKQFISAGGDPEGITLWMFGSMGGSLLADGTWRWKKEEEAKKDYYLTTESTPLKTSLQEAERK
jgi:hypothetical protein